MDYVVIVFEVNVEEVVEVDGVVNFEIFVFCRGVNFFNKFDVFVFESDGGFGM